MSRVDDIRKQREARAGRVAPALPPIGHASGAPGESSGASRRPGRPKSGEPVVDETIQARVTRREGMAALEAAAGAEMTLSAWLRRLVRKELGL